MNDKMYNDAAQKEIDRKSSYHQEKTPKSYQKDSIEHAKLWQAARKKAYYSSESQEEIFQKSLEEHRERIEQNQEKWNNQREKYEQSGIGKINPNSKKDKYDYLGIGLRLAFKSRTYLEAFFAVMDDDWLIGFPLSERRTPEISDSLEREIFKRKHGKNSKVDSSFDAQTTYRKDGDRHYRTM